MTKALHTPGPWGCVDTSNHAHDYRLTKLDGSPLPLAGPRGDNAEQRANARLIAAAPDLLAALNLVLAHDGQLTGADWFAIIEAITKAED